MASFNKVILMGNLTRDPELRVTANGINICKFGLATTRHYTTQSGEKREETAFVDIDCFGRQAEIVSKYFNKGKPILVEGRLKFDQWETKTGEKRSKLSVTLESFQFIGGRQEDNKPQEPGYEQHSPPSRVSEQQQPPIKQEGEGSSPIKEEPPF